MDTLGLLWGVLVHEANVSEREGAKILLEIMKDKVKRINKILADGGYSGEKMIDWVKEICGWVFEVVTRPEMHKFVVIPKRWIVERTFAWIYRFRRMSKDYEYLTETSENMLYLCMIRHMIRRLA